MDPGGGGALACGGARVSPGVARGRVVRSDESRYGMYTSIHRMYTRMLLMRDGRYEIARDLTGPEQHACRAWIDDAGDQFRRHNTDLLDQEKKK